MYQDLRLWLDEIQLVKWFVYEIQLVKWFVYVRFATVINMVRFLHFWHLLVLSRLYGAGAATRAYPF